MGKSLWPLDPGDCVVVESQGGLGNQLFILAYAQELQHRTGIPVLLDTWRHSLTPNRPFELAPLLNPDQHFNSRPFVDGSGWRSLRARLAASRVGSVFKPTVRTEPTLCFSEQMLQVKPGDRLVGYFQSWKYFQSIAPKYRSHLEKFLQLRDSGKSATDQLPSVAVHVRRGDFTHRRHQEAHPLLPKEYFENALLNLHAQIGDYTPVVYSDEPEFALDLIQRLKFGEHATLATEASGSVGVLGSMSEHTGLIMSNSTLSWWAAWLMGFDANRVVIPRVWSNDSTFIWSDLIPTEDSETD